MLHELIPYLAVAYIWTYSRVSKTYTCSLIHDPEEMGQLGELGVLFLLFEMGLELSIDRLKVKKLVDAMDVTVE